MYLEYFPKLLKFLQSFIFIVVSCGYIIIGFNLSPSLGPLKFFQHHLFVYLGVLGLTNIMPHTASSLWLMESLLQPQLLSSCGMGEVAAQGLVAPQRVRDLSSLTRDLTHATFIGGRFLTTGHHKLLL